ncbi:hypothetical protein N7536_008469 [Penicillium majusculum]|uniref:Uncharacterized protein n=1 Tax=Penicillium solitum TaxID=60172 RepID=A0A1V6R924_9EURO|nr:uncharacterized protein PENSOL_c011G09771 [Penicillium solitum]KAJ5685850.1 hypothetical protein N7536_008469 [Penicillium majusculum]OQD97781.1 hypothetical protein PENSOL_c011G09771 [Penicillium solitum]
MQYKSLATLFFASMAIAAPADTSESVEENLSDILPTSIAEVLVTAVPTSFWAEATNTAAFLSQVEQGIVSNSWPTWYSSLPDSVKEYVTTAVVGYYPSFASSISAEITSSSGSSAPSTASATSTGASSSGASSSGASSSDASSSTDSTSATDSSSSSTATGSDAASSSASASASGSAASTTADGGAAPTGITMSLAGAAGVLGLALAL